MLVYMSPLPDDLMCPSQVILNEWILASSEIQDVCFIILEISEGEL